MQSSGAPPLSNGTPEQARAGFRFMTVDLRDPAHLAQVEVIEQRTVPGGAGEVPARVYRPGTSGPHPTIVFFHGGGFVIGDLDTHDDHARLLCRDVDAVVLSVEYRLAPETPFPGGFDDCLAAARFSSGAGVQEGDGAAVGAAGAAWSGGCPGLADVPVPQAARTVVDSSAGRSRAAREGERSTGRAYVRRSRPAVRRGRSVSVAGPAADARRRPCRSTPPSPRSSS